ncbi:MAG: hypothetical protein A2754_02750 [Candidatus Magasanikbacteria bacterium RIFCSPHIGHO2_01_FULL_47_8]|uniref:Uncharacterized protein n=1 Tax=Candidatus Magasanikbacteria bacterium RIFCSPHIGHO2_01_FULL_47_8 TaxID=1798673 RepID=A0A1F6MF07_9BACT|nr:MAG: hypothetical protein A2754_02750 [Candidatus Magasanikbacteria bacterium RIFCSPHIGHO2_01_FULL_47_8]
MNLLAPEQKEIIQKGIMQKFILAIFFMAIFCVFVFLVLEFTIILYIKVQVPALEDRLERERSTEASISAKEAEEDIKYLNNSLKMVDIIQRSNDMDVPDKLRRIGEIVPQGVRMERILVSRSSISFVGKADLRAQILALKNALEQEDFCKNIISSAAPLKESDVDFSFTCESLSEVEAVSL